MQKIPIGSKKKISFVCSGGATKAGAFHLGVALALQEHGFSFMGGVTTGEVKPRSPRPMEISAYVGSSAGSIISSYLASGYSLDSIFNSFLSRAPKEAEWSRSVPKLLSRLTYTKMFKIGNPLDFLKFHKISGLFSTSGIEQYMREEVLPSNRFEDYLADLFIVATQLNHSRKVVFGKYQYEPPAHDLSCQYDNAVSISDACAASTALPVIFSPHAIKRPNQETVYYIDGEVRETLSTHVAIDGGADLVIASYTHQPYHVPNRSLSLTEQGLPAIIIQTLYLLIEQKINQAIFNRKCQKSAIDAVLKYCKEEGLSAEQISNITRILEKELDYRTNVNFVHIHPNPEDAQMFFGDHFSLSPSRMTEIVKSGFRAAADTLRKYEFADRKARQAIGSV